MSRMPRLLPLIAVAIAGVMAINALEGGPGMNGAVKSFAEDVVTPKSAKPAVSPDASVAAPRRRGRQACAGLRADGRRAGQGGGPVAGGTAGPAKPG